MKTDIAKCDRSSTLRGRQGARRRRRRHRGHRVEHVEQSRHRRRAALEQIDHPAERDHGPREAGEVKAEGDECADGDRAPHNQCAANSQHHGDAQSRQQAEQRIHRAVKPRERHVSFHVGLVQRAEARDLGCLLPVGAHDTHASKILLRMRRQRAEVFLHRLEAAMDGAPHPDHDDGQHHHRHK